MAILGSIFVDNSQAVRVLPLLVPDDFYADANRRIWEAIAELAERREPVDIRTVTNHLRATDQIEVIGGVPYLAEVAQSSPLASNSVYYAHIIRHCSQRRALILMSNEIAESAWRDGADIEDTWGTAEAAGRKIVSRTDADRAPTSMREAVLGAMDYIDSVSQKKESAGLLTGLEPLDYTTGGLFPGEMIVLAARPGIGKTSLGCQIATHNASRHRGVLITSLEMSATELTVRIMCSQADVSSMMVRTAKIRDSDIRKLTIESSTLADAKLWIDDSPRITVAQIQRNARRLKREELSLVVIDYLQLLTPRDRRANRYEQVGEMSRELKELARELEIPVLVLCQLNRESEKDGRPQMRHLRESGDIEQNADMILLLARESTDEDSQGPSDPIPAKLIVAKNRSGEIGQVGLDWIPARTMFSAGWTPPHEAFTEFSGGVAAPRPRSDN